MVAAGADRGANETDEGRLRIKRPIPSTRILLRNPQAAKLEALGALPLPPPAQVGQDTNGPATLAGVGPVSVFRHFCGRLGECCTVPCSVHPRFTSVRAKGAIYR